MDRYKYLLKNLGLLTLSSLATKLISFLLVPLYTSCLTTVEYGTYDLFFTTISILLPILTLNIQEAVLRFSLDNRWNQKAIVTISLRYLIISNGLVILGLFINALFKLNELIGQYSIEFFLIFLSQSLFGMVSMYIRGTDKVNALAISSVIASITTILLNIFLLVYLHWGLKGYFLSNIFGPLLQSVYLVINSDVISKINIKSKFRSEAKEMINYSSPLIINSIAWWINNFSDRYIIIFFCGLAENGIYSVASKIPSILNIFQSIFNQAWTLSAVKDFDRNDKKGFFSNTYKIYNCFMVLACSCIILLDKILAKILYVGDFYTAWKYVPWLTIAILFGSLSGYLGGFFSAVKDSKAFANSTAIGAGINILLNFIFTPKYGVLGASIATTISYVIVWGIRLIQSKKYITLIINIKRDIITYLLLIIQSFLIMINESMINIWSFLLFLMILLLYSDDLIYFVKKINRRRSK